jgi:GAF domain-containing protein
MTIGTNESRLAEFAQALCSAEDYRSLLATIVQEICRHLDAENLLLWIYDSRENELTCEASRLTTLNRALAREVCPADTGILSRMLQAETPSQLDNFQATRHLSIIEGSVLRSALFAPMRNRTRPIGILEAINKRGGQFTDEDISLLDDCARLVAPAVAAWRAQETMGSGMMDAVTRMTLLFDVSQSFNSTIEMSDLAPIICNRTANVMEAEACGLWLVRKPEMICRAVYGRYRPELVGQVEIAAGTVVGDMLRSGDALVINDPQDPRIAARQAQIQEGAVSALICAPVKHDGEWLGALEIINRRNGKRFTDEDSILFTEIAGQAAVALRNAQRYEAERKVKELQALIRTSREITSSLDLDRMLAIVVNQAATIIPFDRCAVALLSKGRYRISAIAGEAEVKLKDPKIKAWNEVIDWAGQSGEEIYVSEEGGQIDAERVESREKLQAHFNSSGMKGFYTLPLTDEEGQLGVLAVESKKPKFLSASHLELLKIFAGQATVAIRNAQLYRQVPLIGALEPLAAKKQALLALPKAKGVMGLALAVAVLLVLGFVPWNLKVGGNTYVLPTRTAPVDAEVEGIVEQVNYREGDVAPAGAVIATLRADEHLLNLNEARSRYDIVARELTRVQAVSGASAAQIERVKLDQTRREIALYQAKLEKTQIRAPAGGVIITPRLEEKRGRYIQRGEVFCEMADINPVVIETAVPEDDIGLVAPGQEVWLKANAFPSRKFVGHVARVSPQAIVEGGARIFIVRAEVENPDQSLRTGMLGRAKILTGNHSIGYVLIRDPARWLRTKLWAWTP